MEGRWGVLYLREGSINVRKEHLLVSKALSVFWAPHYFCASSDLSLLYGVYSSSPQAEV